MISIGLSTALVALSSLATLLYIGLGFLPRPSRAAGVWSLAFLGVMIASYAWAAADLLDSAWLRAAASGFMLGMIAMIWVGLRVRRHAAPWHWIAALGFLLAATAVLALLADADAFLTAVRLAFAGAAVFSALTVAELVKLGPLLRDEIMPLALMSVLSIVFATIGVVHECVRLATGQNPAMLVVTTRNLNMLGSLLFLVTAVVTLLLLTRQNASAPVRSGSGSFDAVARDRLQRAQAAGDPWWSVLVVRLDDPEFLRDASSTNAFDQMAARFGEVVCSALPADSDIDRRGATEFVVLLPRPIGAVRQVLATLLEQVAEAGADGPLAVRLSASVGWAGVEVLGYELTDLVGAARTAVTQAQERGGDRWNRVEPAGA